MQTKVKISLILAGFMSIVVSILHIACIFIGAPAYRFLGAGEQMAQMDESGSIIPGLMTAFIAILFLIWGLYAFSGVGLMKRLPLLHIGLAVIASIYTLRGIAVFIQLIMFFSSPGSVLFSEIISSLVSLGIGLTYMYGTVKGWKSIRQK